MPEWLKSLLPKIGLGRAFNSQDSSMEVNLLAYGFGVLAMAAWLSWWCGMGPRDGNFVGALVVFAGAITGGLFKKSAATPPSEGGQP